MTRGAVGASRGIAQTGVDLDSRRLMATSASGVLSAHAMKCNCHPSYAARPFRAHILEDMYESEELYNEGLLSLEYPLFHATDEELDYFLGSLARKVSRTVSSAARTVGSAAKTVGKGINTVTKVIPLQTLTSALAFTPVGLAVRAGIGAASAAADGKNVFQGAVRSLAADPATRFMVDTAAATARGENILKAAQKAAQAGIGDLRESLRFAAMVAPFVPGLGTGVAAALGAANALASGEKITDALIAGARNALPGGALAQTAFDTAANLAKGKNLGEAALGAARARLPGGPAAQAAFDAGLALAKGKNIQEAIVAGGGRLLPKSPYSADVLSFVKKVSSGENLGRAALSAAGNMVLKRVEQQTGPIISRAVPRRFARRGAGELGVGLGELSFVSRLPMAAAVAAQARGAAAIAAPHDVLRSGESIVAKRHATENRRTPHLASRNNRAWLVLQSDGNLVLSTPAGKILWSSKTRGALRMMVQKDGNIVLFDQRNRPFWASKTNRASPAAWGGNPPYLKLQDDGNLVLISGRVPVWSTNSNGFVNRQDEGGWLENAAKSVGRAVESAAHAVGDLSSSVADTLGKVPLIGPGLKGLYGYTYGALIQSVDNVVSGVRLDKALSRHFESQVQNIKGIAPYVQTIISVVPGIGPGISGAISAGLTLAQGRPIDEALVDAAAGAVPGGALAKSVAKMGFAAASGKPLSDVAVSALPIPPAAQDALKAGLRVASDVAQGKRVDRSLLAEANRQIDRLPPEFRRAAQVGVALGQGKKLQDIAMAQLPNLVAVGGPLAAAGQKIASLSPIVRQARGLVGRGQHGFDVAQGLMAHSAVPQHQLERARSAFKGEALKGFDTAVALHMGRVLSPPRALKMELPANAVGYFVTRGAQGDTPGQIMSVARIVTAADPNARAGARVALKELVTNSAGL